MSQLSVSYVLSNLDETKPYQTFRATLDDNTYEFTFQWNTRGEFWTCAIGAVGDIPVIKYKITANSDPLIVYGYSEDLPQGYLNVISLMNTRNRVAIDSIGQEKLHQFIYFTPVD